MARKPIPDKVNLFEKFSQFHEHWTPKIVGELNGQHVKVARFQGEFVWHHHEHEDELFFVVQGILHMQFRDKEIIVNEGEFIIVPRGVEHRPVAPQEALILLFEPNTTRNTGNTTNEKTVETLENL